MASDFIRNLIFGGDRAAQKVKVMGSIMRKSRGHLTIYKLFRDRIKKVGIYVNDEFLFICSHYCPYYVAHALPGKSLGVSPTAKF